MHTNLVQFHACPISGFDKAARLLFRDAAGDILPAGSMPATPMKKECIKATLVCAMPLNAKQKRKRGGDDRLSEKEARSIKEAYMVGERKTILLTGANGFCASRVRSFMQNDYQIVAMTHTALDITDRDACIGAIRTIRPYAVIHSAAIADMNACEMDPEGTFRINVLGPENLATACAEIGAGMIQFSTDQVYSGTTTPAPHTEDATLKPQSVYGRQKRDAEQRILQTGCRAVAVRLTWMYDFPARNLRTGRNLLTMCRRAVDLGEPMTLPSRTKRGITYVYEVVERLPAMLEAPAGIYNFGGAGETTTYEAAKLVFTLMGAEKRAEQLLIPAGEPIGKLADLRMNCTKTEAFVMPFSSTEEGIRRAFSEYGYSY
jgi:dTDP-4-dehydrorhamnose reductase